MREGILIGDDNDLLVQGGTLMMGDTLIQDACIVLDMNQGELKDSPLTGVNLVRMIRGKAKTEKMRKTIEIGLERVGIRFEDIKDQFEAAVNNETI